jgi:MFS family permease
MSWKIAILVAFITALVTGAVTAPVADHVTKAMKVSDMEGGRGYLVVFLILVALVGGAIVGVLMTRVAGAVEWHQFWKAQGFALLAGLGLLFAIAGAFLLSVPSKVSMDGHALGLDFEVLVPKELAPKAPVTAEALRMSLYVGPDDNRYVELDTAQLRWVGETLMITGQAALNTVGHGRMLSLIIADSTSYTLDMPLRARPREEDLAWTDPLPMRLSTVAGTGYTYTPITVRYRVVKKEKRD